MKNQQKNKKPALRKNVSQTIRNGTVIKTRDEFLEEVEDTYIPKYSVVVIYGNGTTRGFVVNADGRKQAMEKLCQKVDLSFITSIHIAEVLLDEDVIE